VLAAERFRRLLSDLALTEDDRVRGLHAHRKARAALQAHYYGHLSIHDHSRLVGAWSKGTEVRPLRSIDLLFVLPKAMREREWSPSESVQLQILLDMKQVLDSGHGPVRLRADGQAIVVAIDQQIVEIRAAFTHQGGQYLLCDASGSGLFRLWDPSLEEANVRQADGRTHGNARDLIRMVKCWQGFRTVPIRSFWIELLVIEFLLQWPRAGDQTSFYDWMIRDFFAFLMCQSGRTLAVPGSGEVMPLGAEWLSAARTAHAHATKACDCESEDLNADAWWEWEKIFGERIPLET
jgi:hypothetical protein